jgi:hypothetical protein
MDFNAENIRKFYYPFGWKNPLIYISLCLAVGLYVYIFFILHENENFGLIERSKEMKVFFVFLITTLLFHFFRASQFIHQIESIIFRGILLAGAVSLAIIFVLPAWMFNEYDNQKMNTYTRILPFNNSPYIRTKNTLLFSNIKSIEYNSGIDAGGALRFLLNDGQKQNFGLGNISSKSRDIFLVTLYDECDWLRDDIEEQLGPIEIRKIYIEGKKEYGHINIIHVLLNIFFLWMFLAEIICLIVYTFKINLKL